MLCVSAASHGRRQVTVGDCLLLKHVFWQTPDEQNALSEWLWTHVVPPEDLVALTYLLGEARTKVEALCHEAHVAGYDSPLVRRPSSFDSSRLELLEEVAVVSKILFDKAAFLHQQSTELRGSGHNGVGFNHLWCVTFRKSNITMENSCIAGTIYYPPLTT